MPLSAVFSQADKNGATPIHCVAAPQLSDAKACEALGAALQSPNFSHWVSASGFKATAGQIMPLADATGMPAAYLLGLGDITEGQKPDLTIGAQLFDALPEGLYYFAAHDALPLPALSKKEWQQLYFWWAMAGYDFTLYKDKTSSQKQLIIQDRDMLAAALNKAEATTLVCDLINTPTEDMGPSDLEDAVQEMANTYGATCTAIIGDQLLQDNFPMIHTVGRAAGTGREPRLIELHWQPKDTDTADLFSLSIVGKGVCFDTGGLDIKPSSAMRLMKKDMGGAAHAIGLSKLIMAHNLPIKLQMLLPAVENAVSGHAFRPGDIYPTRKGLTVEIGNTDAEGRLVLCDALTYAGEQKPNLLVDFATLTGAARVALGPDLPATYVNNDQLWSDLETASHQAHDPLWRMPLWDAYDTWLDSQVADMNNISDGPFAGSITAGLYLQRFINEGQDWIHFDIFGWNPKKKPGKPVGAQAQAIFSVFDYIVQKLEK